MISPGLAARNLHHDLGWTQPSDFSIEEIAFSLGAIVKNQQLNGAEGRILMTDNSAVISVNSDITHIGKRNFVLAHEIGHFTMHKGLKVFLDTNQTLSDWHKKGIHEQQANEFASELLMPTELFRKKVNGQKLSLGLIEDVAAYFSVSLTACFIKYSHVGRYPVMVIYIEKGIVKWKIFSNDFPFQYIAHESKVTAWTVAGDYFNKGTVEAKPVKIDAIEWFPEDFQIKYKRGWKLWEQCFPVSDIGIISCLWSF